MTTNIKTTTKTKTGKSVQTESTRLKQSNNLIKLDKMYTEEAPDSSKVIIIKRRVIKREKKCKHVNYHLC